MNLSKLSWVVAGSLLIGACTVVQKQKDVAEFARYHCGQGVMFDVAYDKNFEHATLSYNDQSWSLTRARSASGMLFMRSEPAVLLHVKGDEALLEVDQALYKQCSRWNEGAAY